MLSSLSPALVPILGAFLVPFLHGRVRDVWVLSLPVVGLLWLLGLPTGDHGTFTYLGLELTPVRIDAWSRIFGIIFFIAAGLAVVYAMHVRDWVQQVAGLVYAGAGVGAVLAGDLVSLFIYWELTMIASVFLIWARKTDSAYKAGMRYLIVQLISGLLLLAGAIMWYADHGTVRFEFIGIDSVAGWLIFFAFGIKCAFPLMHNWLQDAYPEATETGTVYLSAFTTKLAVYSLARGYAGTEILIWIGAVMTAFPIFYAVIENDLRKVLAYSLNNQLGFMVVGIGIGTELALNGTAAHAFCHILYKALLFMSMGAVLFRVGTVNGSQLGGLYKSMPWTTGFCIVGAASISAFPLFSGFVSKSLILTAVAYEGYQWVWLTLLFASAGVFHHSGIKIPYFAFFAHDSGIRCEEAPRNMLVAMGIAAALCIGIGVFPSALYALLPFDIDYVPYTAAHVLSQLQLLMFSALAFSVLMWYGVYPPELRSVNLDTDWFYRRFGKTLMGGLAAGFELVVKDISTLGMALVHGVGNQVGVMFRGDGIMAAERNTNTMVAVVTAVLLLFLLMLYGIILL